MTSIRVLMCLKLNKCLHTFLNQGLNADQLNYCNNMSCWFCPIQKILVFFPFGNQFIWTLKYWGSPHHYPMIFSVFSILKMKNVCDWTETQQILQYIELLQMVNVKIFRKLTVIFSISFWKVKKGKNRILVNITEWLLSILLDRTII